jgi:predicted hotdog family 3-hydroxylacyl-ACP dehydratase
MEMDATLLIPQRPPFVFVDQLIDFDDHSASSTFIIKTQNPMVESNCLMAGGLLENMAQTAAVMNGYRQNIMQLPVVRGYIGAMSNIVIIGLPAVGQRITTTVKLKTKVLNVDIVEAQVMNEEGQILASCEMKIFLEA